MAESKQAWLGLVRSPGLHQPAAQTDIEILANQMFVHFPLKRSPKIWAPAIPASI